MACVWKGIADLVGDRGDEATERRQMLRLVDAPLEQDAFGERRRAHQRERRRRAGQRRRHHLLARAAGGGRNVAEAAHDVAALHLDHAQLGRQLGAAAVGQRLVDDGDVEFPLAREAQRAPAIAGHAGVQPLQLRDPGQVFGEVAAVVDDQHPDRVAAEDGLARAGSPPAGAVGAAARGRRRIQRSRRYFFTQ